MLKLKAFVTAAIAGAAIAVSAVPANAAPIPSLAATVTPNQECISYAETNHKGQNWACFGGTLGLYGTKTNGQPKVTRSFVRPAAATPSGRFTTLARVNDFYSNSTEPLVATIKSVRYTVPINLKVSLYNHSAQVTQSYSSGTAVSATWRMRIRRDNPLWFDDTIYTYGDVYGSSFFTRAWGPNVESRYGEAWNKLPYDGAKYFWDLYGITLKTPTGQIGILGSVQSDRATCYKTVPCKFK